MTNLSRQWAVRLPDGSLFAPTPPPTPSVFPWMLPEEPKPPRVAIFDNETDARHALDGIKKHAQALGITNIGAAVVSRIVGPWGDVDFTEFLAEVEGHANGDAS